MLIESIHIYVFDKTDAYSFLGDLPLPLSVIRPLQRKGILISGCVPESSFSSFLV